MHWATTTVVVVIGSKIYESSIILKLEETEHYHWVNASISGVEC